MKVKCEVTRAGLKHAAHFSSLTVIRRNKEVDIAVGDIRIVILIHEKDGKEFLWPVLRQMPADSNTEGILGGCL